MKHLLSVTSIASPLNFKAQTTILRLSSLWHAFIFLRPRRVHHVYLYLLIRFTILTLTSTHLLGLNLSTLMSESLQFETDTFVDNDGGDHFQLDQELKIESHTSPRMYSFKCLIIK